MPARLTSDDGPAQSASDPDSGRGSNNAALIEAAAPGIPAAIRLVVSDRADAAGSPDAKARSVPTDTVSAGLTGRSEA